MDRDTLLPCPFCGGNPYDDADPVARRVVCETSDCGISGIMIKPEEWNRRALAQQAGDETGWVIVRDLDARGLGYFVGTHEYVPDNLRAVRFAREEDARVFLNYLHGGMVPDIDRVEEHRWCAPNTAADTRCQSAVPTNAATQVADAKATEDIPPQPAVAAPLTMPEEENYTTCYGYAAALREVAQEAIIQANEWKADAARALKTADAEHIRANAAEEKVAALKAELEAARRLLVACKQAMELATGHTDWCHMIDAIDAAMKESK